MLFFGGRNGRGVIWRVPIRDGTPAVLVELAAGNQRFNTFYVTPDGRRVVFAVDKDTPLTTLRHLYSVPLGGGAVVSLDPPLGDEQHIGEYRLSPDGARVLYYVAHSPYGTGEPFSMWSAPVAGGTPVELTDTPTYSGGQQFMFTPNSTYVAYHRVPVQYEPLQLWVVPLAGGTGWQISSPANSSVGSAWFSSDSRHVVYLATEPGNAHQGLYSAPLVPGQPFVRLSDPAFWVGPVALITASRHVVYLSDRAGPDPTNTEDDIRSVPIEGGPSVSLRPESMESIGPMVKLAPDGSRVLFQDFISDALHSASPDGSAPNVNLTPDLPQMARLLDGDMRLSADGSAAFYRVSADNGDFMFDLRVQPATGGQSQSLRGGVATVGGERASDFDYWFELSPDGTFAVFRGGATRTGPRSLYLVELPTFPKPPAPTVPPAPSASAPGGPLPGSTLHYRSWLPATAR